LKTKICCRCRRELPKTREYFHKLSRATDGFYYCCKECAGFSFGKPWPKKTATNNGIKKCTKCERELPLDMFTKLSRTYDGYHPNCKICLNQHRKQYREKNKEYFVNVSRQYRKDNGPSINAGRRRQYIKNRDRITSERRKKYKTDEDYRIKDIINSQNRRVHKKNTSSTLTISQWQVITEYFKNKCAYCGQVKPLEQEHFIPLSKKGEYTHNNIIAACKSCNCSKRDKDFFEWYPKQKFYSPKREKAILNFLGYSKQGTQQPALMI